MYCLIDSLLNDFSVCKISFVIGKISANHMPKTKNFNKNILYQIVRSILTCFNNSFERKFEGYSSIYIVEFDPIRRMKSLMEG